MDPSKVYLTKYKNYLRWRSTNLKRGCGILVGTDITQEWLLPWWWNHYVKHNSFPVAFVDFGMSFEKKEWCKQRGDLIPLRMFHDFVKEKEEVTPSIAHFLEEEFGKHFWDCRAVWFKKPFAFLQTPFDKSIWIDLDCEIRSSLEDLFQYADTPPYLGMIKDPCDSLLSYDYPIYNSGVVPFQRESKLVIDWAKACLKKNGSFRGDQEVLSNLIAKKGISLVEIPSIYNWSRVQDDRPETKILHWHGVFGKRIIRTQINNQELNF